MRARPSSTPCHRFSQHAGKAVRHVGSVPLAHDVQAAIDGSSRPGGRVNRAVVHIQGIGRENTSRAGSDSPLADQP